MATSNDVMLSNVMKEVKNKELNHNFKKRECIVASKRKSATDKLQIGDGRIKDLQ